jgi:hypothetical protein
LSCADISLPLIAALRAAEAPVIGHRLFAVVAQASRLKSVVWLPGGVQAGLSLLFFSDGGLVENVGHKKDPAQRPGKADEAAGDNC